MLRYLSDYKRESVLAPLFKMLEATVDLFVPLVMADIVNVGIAAHDFTYFLVRCATGLLSTSTPAADHPCVDFGGARSIKKKKTSPSADNDSSAQSDPT